MLSKAILTFSEGEALARGGPSGVIIRICVKITRTVALCCIFSGSDDPQYLGFQRPPGSCQKHEPRLQINGLEQERRATISASLGQGRGVVWVTRLQRWGGSRRWLTRWRTLWNTTRLLSQRAEPSPLWSGPCLESLIGSGLARISRVG